MSKCRSCGTELRYDAVYCHECGSPRGPKIAPIMPESGSVGSKTNTAENCSSAQSAAGKKKFLGKLRPFDRILLIVVMAINAIGVIALIVSGIMTRSGNVMGIFIGVFPMFICLPLDFFVGIYFAVKVSVKQFKVRQQAAETIIRDGNRYRS